MNKTQKLVISALMTAAGVLFTRFLGLTTTELYIGIGELPTYIAALLLGPGWGMATGALVDLIGHFLKPMGAYFPGFTFSCALTGLIPGLLLYGDRNVTYVKLLLTVFITQFICSLVLGPLWLSILFGKAFWAYIPGRLIKQAITVAVYPVMLFGLLRVLRRTHLIY